MKTFTRILSLAALALAPLGAAHAASNPFACGVIDAPAFVDYVKNHQPTLVDLKARASCLRIVMPGDVTTMEFRVDNSRFFAQTDEHGRIVDGSFH